MECKQLQGLLAARQDPIEDLPGIQTPVLLRVQFVIKLFLLGEEPSLVL